MAPDLKSGSGTWLARLRERLFPGVPDFYALLDDQCRLLEDAMAAFVQFMRKGDPADAARVREKEHVGDAVKHRNMDILHRAFATPMDREDIYRAISAIDEILNYAKTAVHEMEGLGVKPDEHTLAMAETLKTGAEALRRGFGRLRSDPEGAEADAEAARKSERHTEKLYRSALAELFDARHYAETLTREQARDKESLAVLLAPGGRAEPSSILSVAGFVFEILKRREIYRHLSNAADHVARAGEVLHDILVKES